MSRPAVNVAEIPVVILAGGRGARFDHESQVTPKPMIEVAGRPMLQHIIDSFVDQGFREFIIATGYLREHIESWFNSTGSLFAYDRNVGQFHYKINLTGDDRYFVKCLDTGEHSHTGDRLLKVWERGLIDRTFILTYGDGLSDVKMEKVIEQHMKDSRDRLIWWGEERPDETAPALITVTSVKPPGRFGAIEFCNIDDWGVGPVDSFQEKPQDAWINGGFMVVEPEFVNRYLAGDLLEAEAMPKCASDGLMRAYKHKGYWRCMDTRRDLEQIESDVSDNGGRLPWRGKMEDK